MDIDACYGLHLALDLGLELAVRHANHDHGTDLRNIDYPFTVHFKAVFRVHPTPHEDLDFVSWPNDVVVGDRDGLDRRESARHARKKLMPIDFQGSSFFFSRGLLGEFFKCLFFGLSHFIQFGLFLYFLPDHLRHPCARLQFGGDKGAPFFLNPLQGLQADLLLSRLFNLFYHF